MKRSPKDFTPAQRELITSMGLQLRAVADSLIPESVSLTSIADRIGITLHGLHARLTGKENLTLASIASTAEAMGFRVEFAFKVGKALRAQRAEGLRSLPIEPPSNALHAMIGTIELPVIENTKVPGGRFKAATVRNVLHSIAGIGFRWIAVEELSRKSGVSLGALMPILPALEREHLIEIERRPRKGLPRGAATCRYRVRPEMFKAQRAASKESAA